MRKLRVFSKSQLVVAAAMTVAAASVSIAEGSAPPPQSSTAPGDPGAQSVGDSWCATSWVYLRRISASQFAATDGVRSKVGEISGVSLRRHYVNSKTQWDSTTSTNIGGEADTWFELGTSKPIVASGRLSVTMTGSFTYRDEGSGKLKSCTVPTATDTTDLFA